MLKVSLAGLDHWPFSQLWEPETQWHTYSDVQLPFAVSDFARFVNESRLEASNSVPHHCELLLLHNTTDLYDRECYLYFNNNTNMGHSITTGRNYTNFIKVLKDRFDQHGSSCKISTQTQLHSKDVFLKVLMPHLITTWYLSFPYSWFHIC